MTAAAEDALAAPFAAASAAHPYVVAQLGQSLDGRVATVSGHSRYINGPAALDHLHRLRAQADAVLVGIGTVLADDPLLTVRRVPGRNPVRVVIDPSGRMPATARCLVADANPTLLLHAAGSAVPEGAESVVLPGISLKPIDDLAGALRPAVNVHVLGDSDFLVDCDLRSGG